MLMSLLGLWATSINAAACCTFQAPVKPFPRLVLNGDQEVTNFPLTG